MKRAIAVLTVGLLAGCEGAVLVNNRPANPPNNNTAQTEAVTASDRQGATYPAPATQSVETRNTRIETPAR
jgi:hypothetical protein